MKICIIVSKSDVGGATIYAHNLMEGFDQEIDLFYIYKGDKNNQGAIFGKFITDFYSLRFSDFPLIINRLILLFNNNKYDVVNFHGTEAAFFVRVALLFSSVKSLAVYTVHGWGWRGFDFVKSSGIKLVELFLHYATNNKYIVLYEKCIEEALFLNRNNFHLIHTGIKNKNVTFQFNTPNLVFLFPARIDRAKNHLGAIKLLSSFNFFNPYLTFIGHNTDSNNFKSLINNECVEFNFNYDNIFFKGLIHDVGNEYMNSKFVILLSHFEALPLSIIEALSFGLPCVVSNVGGNSELIIDCYNGVLVEDSMKFSNKQIEFLLKCFSDINFYNKVRLNSLNHFKENFEIELMIKSYKDSFNLFVG
jgi:glycosyltransferase involved in cell wall biosynthesis